MNLVRNTFVLLARHKSNVVLSCGVFTDAPSVSVIPRIHQLGRRDRNRTRSISMRESNLRFRIISDFELDAGVQFHFFPSGFQLRRTVMGEAMDSSTGRLIRNRPSRETAYWALLTVPALPLKMRVGNSGTGFPGSKVEFDAVTATAISPPSGAMK